MGDFLLLAFIFLVAGVVAVPIAARLQLGSVLGYLIAGIAISPVLTAFNVDVVAIQHFAEFGVVMMLFLVGLELEPKRLWEMRSRLLGLGGLQVAGTVLAVAGIAYAFGQPWTVSIAIGFILALSSTAIVLQTLNEKGLMRSDGGQSSFSVLLFQDIAVIPMLAVIPLLALPELVDAVAHSGDLTHGGSGHGDVTHGSDSHGADDHGGGGHGPSLSLVDGLVGWQQALVTMGAIAFVIFAGSYCSRPIFRFIAMANLRELFTATALLLVIGIALLMTLVNLSPALGTFLAGVVLANSEYRHELESDIDPFRGLLLGLFFITVGAGVDFDLLSQNAVTIIGMTLGVMGLKAAILMVLAYLFRIQGADKWLFALGLAQAGEFGFVLLSFTVASNVLPSGLADQLLLVVALSMLLTPVLFILYDRLFASRSSQAQERDADEIESTGNIIIAGHGRFGGIVNRMLRGAGFSPTVLDYGSEQLDLLRAFGFKVFFGDATRPDLLHAAGIDEAKMLVIAIDNREHIVELTKHVTQNHPHVHVIARALDRQHVYELYAAGCRDIIRETFDSSVRVGRSAYEALGIHPFEAERLARQFVKDDLHAIRELAQHYDPTIPVHQNEEYIAKSKEYREAREAEMTQGSRAFSDRADRGWRPPNLNDVAAEQDANDN